MPTIYQYAGTDSRELHKSYGKLVREEFYDGELGTDASSSINITVQKGLANPISLMRMTSNTSICYRREWHHVRMDKTLVRVLWFVNRGSLRVVRSGDASTTSIGECAILDSGRPFNARAIPDSGGIFDFVLAIIPTPLFVSRLPIAINQSESFGVRNNNRQFVGKLLDLMLEDYEHLGRNMGDAVAATFLQAIADNFSETGCSPNVRLRIADKRLADIESYIAKNMSNADLTCDEVALKCGISPRYLCYVLKHANKTFSQLLWEQRLARAREWLASPVLCAYPINEIAYMAGFKCAAHFSRMFKASHGLTPKEYRNRESGRSQKEIASPAEMAAFS